MSPCDCNLPEWECELLAREDTPTQIDPADIRPGDVWEMRRRVNVQSVSLNDPELFWDELGNPWRRRDDWHLVHRPDPDADAVEALLAAGDQLPEDIKPGDELRNGRAFLAALREQGWDLTRRQNGQGHA